MTDDRPPAIAALDSAISERAGHARYEHEDFSCIAEPIMTQCKPTADVVWDMVEEYEPKRDTATRVEAKVAMVERIA
jgi:hypothetical protein